MLKKDKNGFIEVIKANDFDPKQFRRFEKEVDDNPGFIIQLQNSPLYFCARTNSYNYHEHDCRFIEFAPSFPKSDYFPRERWGSIEDVYGWFNMWLTDHVASYIQEMEIPDLWEQMEGLSPFSLDPIRSRNESSFDKVEKERIRASLEHFKKLIEVEYTPTDDQLSDVVDRIEYLSDSLDRLNRVDWQGIAISTVISISIALSLDTEKGKTLFDMFKKSFASAIGYFT